MKKVLSISLIAITLVLLAVSCNPGSKAVDDGLALVSFSTEYGGKRSLEKVNPTFDKESYYWYYTATKNDKTGLTTGVETDKKAVKTGKGLDTVGPFSYGDWIFTLYAFGEKTEGGSAVVDTSKLVFQGSSNVTIKEATPTIKVTVSAQMTGKDGFLELPKKGDITITKSTTKEITPDYTKLVEKISILSLDTENAEAADYYDLSTAVNERISIGDSGERKFTLESGSYAVTVSYLEGATKKTGSTDGEDTYSGGYSVAKETIYVTVYDYLTTKIGGDIVEYTGDATFTVVSDGVFTSAKVEALSVSDEKNTETTITVKASPATKTNSKNVEEQETTVTIEKGAIAGLGSGASSTLSVTAYDQAAAASAIPTFTITTSGGSSTEATTIGALDIELMVKKSSSDTATPIHTFAEGKTLTISTTIAKGLDGSKIKIPYNGEARDGDKSDGTFKSYDPSTGLLTFTVTHLSQYYVVVEGVEVYVPANGGSKVRTFETFEKAIENAVNGDTLVLWKNVNIGNAIEIDRNLTLDLNRKTIKINDAGPFLSIGSFFEENNSSIKVIIKNGYIETDRTDSDSDAGKIIFATYLGCELELNDVVVKDNTNNGYVFSALCMSTYSGSQDFSTKFVIKNSKIYTEGNKGAAVFVANIQKENKPVVVEITDSVVESSGAGSVAVSAGGYDGPVSVNIANSTIEGNLVGVELSSGVTAVIEDSEITGTGAKTGEAEPSAIAIEAEKSSVSLKLKEVTLDASRGSDLYICSKESNTAEVTGSVTSKPSIKINGYGDIIIEIKDRDTTYVAGAIESLPEGVNIELLAKTTVKMGKVPNNHAVESAKGQDVEWRVLEVDNTNKKALVISEKVLETRALMDETVEDAKKTAYSWKESSIRKYLNGAFISDYGLSGVRMTKETLKTEMFGNYPNLKEEESTDNVFLLSLTEALPNIGYHYSNDGETYVDAVGKSKYFEDNKDLLAYDLKGNVSGWWLRSPSAWGTYSTYAEYMYPGSESPHQYSSEFADAYNKEDKGCSIGIRPAFWLELSKN